MWLPLGNSNYNASVFTNFLRRHSKAPRQEVHLLESLHLLRVLSSSLRKITRRRPAVSPLLLLFPLLLGSSVYSLRPKLLLLFSSYYSPLTTLLFLPSSSYSLLSFSSSSPLPLFPPTLFCCSHIRHLLFYSMFSNLFSHPVSCPTLCFYSPLRPLLFYALVLFSSQARRFPSHYQFLHNFLTPSLWAASGATTTAVC